MIWNSKTATAWKVVSMGAAVNGCVPVTLYLYKKPGIFDPPWVLAGSGNPGASNRVSTGVVHPFAVGKGEVGYALVTWVPVSFTLPPSGPVQIGATFPSADEIPSSQAAACAPPQQAGWTNPAGSSAAWSPPAGVVFVNPAPSWHLPPGEAAGSAPPTGTFGNPYGTNDPPAPPAPPQTPPWDGRTTSWGSTPAPEWTPLPEPTPAPAPPPPQHGLQPWEVDSLRGGSNPDVKNISTSVPGAPTKVATASGFQTGSMFAPPPTYTPPAPPPVSSGYGVTDPANSYLAANAAAASTGRAGGLLPPLSLSAQQIASVAQVARAPLSYATPKVSAPVSMFNTVPGGVAPRGLAPRALAIQPGAAGMADYGSTMGYDSALQGIQGAADHGNVAQAQALLGQLSQIFQNDLGAGRITDLQGLQNRFNNAAGYIQSVSPWTPKVDAHGGVSASATSSWADWQAVINTLQNNAAALDADVAYQNSQGNFASSAAGAAADPFANSGAGFMNAAAGGPGGSSVVNWGAAGAAAAQATGADGVLGLPAPLAWILNNPGKALGAAAGAVTLVYVGPTAIRRAKAWAGAIRS